MGRYKIEFSKSAVNDYQDLPLKYKILIDQVLTKFAEGKIVDIKPIKSEKDIYRIRVGKYRILLVKVNNTFIITKISHRKDVYKK